MRRSPCPEAERSEEVLRMRIRGWKIRRSFKNENQHRSWKNRRSFKNENHYKN